MATQQAGLGTVETRSPAAPAVAVAGRAPRGVWTITWERFRRHRLALVGLAVIAVLGTLAPAGPRDRPVRAQQD